MDEGKRQKNVQACSLFVLVPPFLHFPISPFPFGLQPSAYSLSFSIFNSAFYILNFFRGVDNSAHALSIVQRMCITRRDYGHQSSYSSHAT